MLRARGAISSVGRAPARQAGGHWFEPSIAHSGKGPQERAFFVVPRMCGIPHCRIGVCPDASAHDSADSCGSRGGVLMRGTREVRMPRQGGRATSEMRSTAIWLGGRSRLIAVAAAATLAFSSGPLDSTPRAVAANPAATVIARYRARIPRVDGGAGYTRPCRRARRQGPGVVGRGLRPSRRTGLGSRDRRHDLQRPVDVEAVHGDRGHAGRRGRSPRPRRADHDLPARVHRPQRVRGAPGTEDHASDAPQPHRWLHARGAGG